MENYVLHPLRPIYNEHSRVLILGTMPSPASRTAAFFYAHPQNRFWPVLCRVLKEELPPDKAGKTQLLLRRGIALWDAVASCTISGAQDSTIKNVTANDFAPIFKTAKIGAVFTTGKKAGQLYKKYCADQYPAPFFVLPSPSAANCAMKTEQLEQEYRQLLPYLKEEK